MSWKETIVQGLSNLSYKIQENSPTILVVTGVVGVVTSTVLACRATIKARTVIEETKKDLEMIHDCEANKTLEESGEYTKEDAKRDKVTVTVKTVVKLGKHYILPLAILILSIWMILSSHGIMVQRNTALAAAYTGLASSFDTYRKRVIKKFGDGVDKELKYGLKAEQVDEEIEKEDGTKETKKVEKITYDKNNLGSPYAKFFDSSSPFWTEDPEYNLTFLIQLRTWLNTELVSRHGKPLYLNEVYDKLGLERTDAGQVVGWRYRPDDPSHLGDNVIRFGLPDEDKTISYSEAMRRFWNGLENVVLLDFNVDGEVYQVMPRKSAAKAHVYGH